MALSPELRMSGKFKTLFQSPTEELLNSSVKSFGNDSLKSPARYAYKARLNIEIEETFNFPENALPRDNFSIYSKTSLLSKKSLQLEDLKDPDSLHYQFLDILEAFNSPEQVFDMINCFVSCCSDAIDSNRFSYTDKNWLQSEKKIWRLIYALYQNRLHYINEEEELCPENDLDIMKNFFQNNNSIRECQLVVDWLEECASVKCDQTKQPKLSHFMDKTVAWENTLHQLQVKNVAFPSARPLISAMDPDAPLREKKQLHDLDAEDESRLLEQVFLEIRCGRLNKALEICSLCGHKWRAAILQGWMLFNDPNYKCTNDAVISAFGNPHRDIWKFCAWKLTENSASSAMWKAILGVYCGNISVLLPMCKDWEDLLWAYLKVYIDVKVEEELRAVSLKEYVSLPDEYYNFKFTLDEIFEELAGYNDNNVRIEAAKPERIIQRLIITDRIPELISILSDWCMEDNANHHILRTSAHIVLYLRMIGNQYNEQHTDNILKSYVRMLMKTKDTKLVAYYTAMLSEEDQIYYFSEFIESIDDENVRIKCLEAAEMCHLQVEEITKRVVRVIRDKPDDVNKSLDLATGITKEDERKIAALDLIMYYFHQRDEALYETNALIRYFLLQRNLQAANHAFCRIPENSIEIVLKKYDIDHEILLTNPESLPDKVFAAVREYFCYKVYLNAEMKFSDWFHSFHKLEPVCPSKPPEDAQYTQKVAYEHHLSQYKSDYKKWKTTLEEQTKITKSHLYNVLLFPDGGWLFENRYFSDSTRMNQMNSLRKICVPKIVILLHTILHSMELYDECIKLADIITSETYQIYKAYSVQDLGEIMRKICDSSLCFLSSGKDPWGMQISS